MPNDSNSTEQMSKEELIEEIVHLAEKIKISRDHQEKMLEEIAERLKRIEIKEKKIDMFDVEKEKEVALAE